MKRYRKALSALLAVAMVIAMLPVNPVFADGEAPGTAVSFVDGVFTDELNGAGSIAQTDGKADVKNGYLLGTGSIVYKLDDGDTLKGFALDFDCINQAWDIDYDPQYGPKAYVAALEDGTYVKGEEIPMFSMFRADEITDSGKPKFRYTPVSKLPEDVQYLWIELPKTDWYGADGEWYLQNYALGAVQLYSQDYAGEFLNWTVDPCDALQDNYDGMSLISGDKRLGRDGQILHGDGTMTYTVEEGGITDVQVAASYGNNIPPEKDYVKVWYAAADGSYQEATDVEVAIAAAGERITFTVHAVLPEGTKSIQIKPGAWADIVTVAYAANAGGSSVTPPVEEEGQCLKVVAVSTDSNQVYLLHEGIAVEANTNYTLTAEFKGPKDAKLQMRAVRLDNWADISPEASITVTTDGSNEWKKASMTFNTGDFAGNLTLGVYNWFLSNDGSSIYVDNFSLKKEGSDDELVKNGDFEECDLDGDPSWQWFPGWMGGFNQDQFMPILVKDAVVEGGVTPPDPGSAVISFDGNGMYTDTLDTLNHMAAQEGLSVNNGGVSGLGHMVYAIDPDAALNGVVLSANFNIWSMTFAQDAELKLYAASYDGKDYAKGSEIQLVRMMKPGRMSSKDIYTADYVSGSIPSGTQYIWVEMPAADFYGSGKPQTDYKVEGITFYSTQAGRAFYDYTIDRCANTDLMFSATEAVGPNLETKAPSEGWFATDVAKVLNRPYDQGTTDAEMVYRAAEGDTLKSIFVQAHYFAKNNSGKQVEIWASENGTEYTQVSTAEEGFSGQATWDKTPTAIYTDLPAGTKYVKIVLPKLTWDDIGDAHGMAGPAVAYIAVGGKTTTDGQVEPPQPDYPVTEEYTIRYAEKGITADGVFQEDEWADADAMYITGATGKEENHYGTIYLKYDENYLYWATVINDTTPMNNSGTGANIWNGDSVEIFYGTDLDTMQDSMLASDIQILLSGSKENGLLNTIVTGSGNTFPTFKDMDIAKRYDGEGNEIGYTIEAVIPLELLEIENPWEGKEILFNANIKNGEASQQHMGWTTMGDSPKKNRSLWGHVFFEQAAAPTAEITVQASVDQAANEVTLSGLIRDGGEQRVALLVRNAAGEICYLNQVKSEESGRYSHVFVINEAGTYTATVGSEKTARTASVQFTIDNTLIPVDYTLLQQALAAYDALDPAGYTADSWAASNIDALAQAGRALLNNPAATQAAVNAAAQAIRNAIGQLVKAETPVDPKPQDPAKPYEPATRYLIVATAGEGGSISPAGNVYVEKGANQTFTITPDAGYRVKSVMIDRKKEVELVNGAFTFTNVDEPYTIDVTFEKVEDSIGIEVTNPEKPQATPNPQTGDSNYLAGLGILALLSGGVLLAAARKKRGA